MLSQAGWDTDPHSIAEQCTISDGRVVPVGKGFIRRPPKRVDYLLRYTRDFPIDVLEAKASYKHATDAIQQARHYAEMLDLKFAYATNGQDIVEIDYFTDRETRIRDYPKPAELCHRYQQTRGVASPRTSYPPPRPPKSYPQQRRPLLPADRHQPHGRSDKGNRQRCLLRLDH
jgi:type I restriction enzyme, R subunit